LAEDWDKHSRLALNDVERYVFNPVNYFLIAKRFAVDWQQTIDQQFTFQSQTAQRTILSPLVAHSTKLFDSSGV